MPPAFGLGEDAGVGDGGEPPPVPPGAVADRLCPSEVDAPLAARGEHGDRVEWTPVVEAEMTGEVVAGAGGDDAEDALRLGDEPGELAHDGDPVPEPVPAARDHAPIGVEGGARERTGVLEVGGDGDVDLEVGARERVGEAGEELARAGAPRARGHDPPPP